MFEPVKWQGGNTAVPPAVFRRYIEINLARGLPEIKRGAPRNRPLYIVCSGPSLRDTWREIDWDGGDVWAVNGAFDWLRRKGLGADTGICLAAENQILNYFQTPIHSDRFLFAAQTHPELVDRVLDRCGEVTLWHPAHPEGWDLPVTKGAPLIHGGGTIGTRAIDLAWTLGYRDVHLLGFDACVSPDGFIGVDVPMYEDRKDDLKQFMIGGRVFVSLPSYARQVEDFAACIRPLTGLTVTFYGDGLMQWAFAQQGEVTWPNQSQS